MQLFKHKFFTILIHPTGYIYKTTLHVLDGSVNAYRQKKPWTDFKNIVALTNDDPQPTGIQVIDASDNDKDTIYDLNGRRLEQPSKGIYIKKGKKFIVK